MFRHTNRGRIDLARRRAARLELEQARARVEAEARAGVALDLICSGCGADLEEYMDLAGARVEPRHAHGCPRAAAEGGSR
jgi:hypothetical protein